MFLFAVFTVHSPVIVVHIKVFFSLNTQSKRIFKHIGNPEIIALCLFLEYWLRICQHPFADSIRNNWCSVDYICNHAVQMLQKEETEASSILWWKGKPIEVFH